MLQFRRILFVAIFSICPSCLHAAPKDWPVGRGPSREPQPFVFDREFLKKASKEYFTDYPAFYVRAATWYAIEEDGTVESTTHEIVRLNNRRGIDQLGEHRSITFRPEYEKLTINEARVLKADGGEIAVQPSHLQLRDVQTDYSVYETTKELIISFPGLDVGDSIEVKWTTRGKNPEYAGHFFTRYHFGDDKFPIWQETFGLRAPKKKTLKYALINPQRISEGNAKPEVTEKDGFKQIVWRMADRLPFPKEEMPPPKEESRPGIAISTFATWKEVAAWERKARAPCWECAVDLKKIVELVKKRHKKPEDIARELTYWVRDNIRYVSNGDKHDFTPHAPAFIFKNRFGDCKDGVQLLTVLLKEAGIPSALVSLNPTGDGQIDESLPSPLATHALLLVAIDGVDHWIDTTASRAGWDYLPKSDRDRNAYAVDDTTFRMMRTPRFTAADNRAEFVTRMKIDADGNSRNVRAMTYSGEAALDKRDEWYDISALERRRLIRTELIENNGKMKLGDRIDIDENALRRFHEPVKATIEFEILKHLSGDGTLEGTVSDHSLWSHILSVNVDPERTRPIELKEPFESKQTFQVQVPPGYRLGPPPPDRDFSSKWGRFRRTIEADETGRGWTIVFHTQIERTRVEKADFDTFQRFQEHMTTGHRATIAMKPLEDAAGIGADIEELEKLQKQPKDLRAAIELIGLYLKAGRGDDAKALVTAARKQFPNERKLLELAIEVGGEPKEVEAVHRDLIARFPDEPRLVFDLARKLIDADENGEARDLLMAIKAKSTSAERAEAMLLLAKITLAEDGPANALKDLEDARKANAATVESAEGCNLRGEILEALDKNKEALDSREAVLVLDGNNAEALEALIRLRVKIDDKPEALKILRRYIENAGNLTVAAEWYYKLGRLEDAEELIDRDPPKEPSDPRLRILGMIHLKRGNLEKAIENLAKYESPDSANFTAIISSNLELGKAGEAVDWAGKAKELEDASEDLKRLIAAMEALGERRETLQNEHPLPEAASQIDAFLSTDYLYTIGRPDSQVGPLLVRAFSPTTKIGPAFALRAEFRLNRGQLSKSLSDADEAIKTSPNEARGYYIRGRIRLERSQPAATADLRKAIELSGAKDARMLHWLAASLLQEKKVADALKYQEMAAKLLPDDEEIEEQLQRIREMK